jgi:hypothetical protein
MGTTTVKHLTAEIKFQLELDHSDIQVSEEEMEQAFKVAQNDLKSGLEKVYASFKQGRISVEEYKINISQD